MKPHLLIMDDDASVRAALIKVLETAGYQVSGAADGQEGIICLNETRFHLLILDLELPKVSGWDVLDLVMTRFPKMPVIVMSAFFDQCVPGALTGADALLEKPPDVSRLLAVVADLSTGRAEEQLRKRSYLAPAARPPIPMPLSPRRPHW